TEGCRRTPQRRDKTKNENEKERGFQRDIDPESNRGQRECLHVSVPPLAPCRSFGRYGRAPPPTFPTGIPREARRRLSRESLRKRSEACSASPNAARGRERAWA